MVGTNPEQLFIIHVNKKIKMDDVQIESYSNELETQGIVVVPNAFSQEEIAQFSAETNRLWEQYKGDLAATQKQPRTYITQWDKVYEQNIFYFQLPDGTHIDELAEGRYDFPLDTERGIFSSPMFLNDTLKRIMDNKLKWGYTSLAGALPAERGSAEGLWHRDTYPFFANGPGCYDDAVERSCPPFYYTVLIPLQPLTPENGATEFIPGSHRLSYAQAVDEARIQPTVEVGSAVIFDGRVFHRGRANRQEHQGSRMVLYQVYHKSWYNDY